MSKQAAYKRFGKPVDPTTGQELTRHTSTDVVKTTERLFTLIAAGDYDAVEALMHPQTVTELPRELIAETWRQVLTEVGELEGFSEGRVETPGGGTLDEQEEVLGTVVGVTTLTCEAGVLQGRVAVTPQRQVVGILIVPPGQKDLPF